MHLTGGMQADCNVVVLERCVEKGDGGFELGPRTEARRAFVRAKEVAEVIDGGGHLLNHALSLGHCAVQEICRR